MMKKKMRWVRRALSLALVLQLCLAGAAATGAAEPRTAGLKESGTIAAAAVETQTAGMKESGKAIEAAAPGKTETQTVSNPAVGLWKLSGMTGSEGAISPEELKAYEAAGVVIYMEMNEDGSVVLHGLTEDQAVGTWDDKAVTMNGSPASYTLNGDKLTLQIAEDSMEFERTTQDAVYALLGYKAGVLDEKVEYSKEEQTILDTDDVRIKITGYQADMKGFTVKLHCENKGDKKLVVNTDNSVLNKNEIDPTWAVILDAKETKDTEMTFSPLDLEKCGITAVDEIILRMQVADSEAWTMVTEDAMATVYPTGKKAEDIKAADRKPVDKEVVVVDNDDCTFILQGATDKEILGYGVNCYFENKTDKMLTVTWNGTKVNGQDVIAYYAEEVLPGTRGCSKALFLKSSLEEKGIADNADVKEISGTLKVYTSEGSSHETIVEQPFTYAP